MLITLNLYIWDIIIIFVYMETIEYNRRLRIDRLSSELSCEMTKRERMLMDIISSMVIRGGYDLSDEEIDGCIGLVDRVIIRLNV